MKGLFVIVGILSLTSTDAWGKAREFSGFVNVSGNTSTESWQGYGDSIMAGFCGIACQQDSYLVYYAEQAAAELNADIDYDSDAVSGETTSAIRGRMSSSELSSADAIVWSAGGNDFLDARDDFRDSCDEAALEAAMGLDRLTGLPLEPKTGWVSQWDQLIDRVEDHADPSARVRTMNIYYPGVDDDLSGSCGAKTHFDTFLPLLLAAGDYMCNTAWDRGYDCADAIYTMNCEEGDLADCPTTHADWLALGGDAFVGNFGDPWALGLLQGDNTHPNDAGHQAIGEAHAVLGY